MLTLLLHAHPAAYMPDDQGPVGPSAIAIKGDILLADGSKAKFSVPRVLKTEEMPQIVDQFVVGARNSLAAGVHALPVVLMQGSPE